MITEQVQGFIAPNTMTPGELGDTLARLVWESFSDFLAEGEAGPIFEGLRIPVEGGMPPGEVSEEVLIFLMWAHTRALQLAFVGRAPEPLLRAALDALHRAMFEDLANQGTPYAYLPFLEQRVSSRYAEYYQASEVSDDRVGQIALALLAGTESRPAASPPPAHFSRLLTERAIAVANPLRDFLEDVELVAT